jgi:hypothetical protein
LNQIWKIISVLAISIAVLAVLVGRNPSWIFSKGKAVWIQESRPLNLVANSSLPPTRFRKKIATEHYPDQTLVWVKSLGDFAVYWDDHLLGQGMGGREISLPLPPANSVPSGHVLEVRVHHEMGPNCVRVRVPALGIVSDTSWESQSTTQTWKPCQKAGSWEKQPLRSMYPAVWQSFSKNSRLLALLAVLAVSAGLGCQKSWFLPQERVVQVASGMIWLAWIVLAIHNFPKIATWGHGFDLSGQYDYISHIIKYQLPKPSSGGQAFQAPLFYILSGLLYTYIRKVLGNAPFAQMALHLLPLACGALQIEISRRFAALLHPDKRLQGWAMLLGSLIPMNLYMSHYLGPEPLCGVLSGIAMLYCLKWVKDPENFSAKSYAALGALLGFAVLTKVTALLLGAAIGAIAFFLLLRKRLVLRRFSFAPLSALIACGWFFARNQILYGKPLFGGWSRDRDLDWWQDPGYRTLDSITSFGECLRNPIYASTSGFWDGWYASTWLDSYLGSSIDPTQVPSWNLPLMTTLAWLSLLPTALIILGFFLKAEAQQKPGLAFVRLVAVLYGVALLLMFVSVPHYSSVKGSYLMACLPLFAFLAARALLRLPQQMALPVKALLLLWAAVCYLSFWTQ